MAAFESKRYSWKGGYAPSVKAEIVGEVFSRIEERDGEVTSKSFLDASRAEDSPTHALFTWDDAEAAEKYRLSQSSKIINQLQIDIIVEKVQAEEADIEIEPETTIKSPAYVNVNPVGRFGSNKNTTGSFVNVQKAMSDEDMRKIVLNNALRELNTFKSRYALYKELKGVFEAIKEFERSIE